MEEEQKAHAGGEPGTGALCCRAQQIWCSGVSVHLKACGWLVLPEVVLNTFPFSVYSR